MLNPTWRWFGPSDNISLDHIKMTGAKGIVSALHHIPIGDVWEYEEIVALKSIIESKNLSWDVVESIPVHESIKYGGKDKDYYIENYIKSIENMAKAGLNILCYNFMPVVDWTRTDLRYKYYDNSLALRFDFIKFIIFDLYILKRSESSKYYSSQQLSKAEKIFKSMTSLEKEELTKTILQGLPGSNVESYKLENFKKKLDNYKDLLKVDLSNNLKYFLSKIVPICEKNKVYLAIHPDDPPIDLFGIPRIVSSAQDMLKICDYYPSKYNGVTLCIGSLASKECNVKQTIDLLADKANFIHLRNVKKDSDKLSFTESNHLDGDIDMNYVICKTLYQIRDFKIPFRPDHGHLIYDDIDKIKINPGYSYIGRLKGLGELNGIIYSQSKKITYQSFIYHLKKDRHKVIPIVKNRSDILKINFNCKFIELVLRNEESYNELTKIKECNKILTCGTITSKKDIDICISKNINIFFCPHLDEDLIKYAFENQSIIIPGVLTPTEIIKAYKMGVSVVKFFPSGNNYESLQQYSNVFDKLGIKYIATGGINNDNYKKYLSIKNVIAVGSSNISEIFDPII